MNNSIRDYLINIYDKLSHKATLLNGIALFKYLIKKEFYVDDKCNYIIKEINEQTNKLNGDDKKECLILLPYFFLHQTSLKYLTKILHILFSQINHTTVNIFTAMAKIFADILINIQTIQNQNSYTDLIPNYTRNSETSNQYENILLRLCLDLIDNNNISCIFKSKNHDFSLENYQQKSGYLFLGQFIEHYNNLQSDQNTLNIIINLLKSNFYYLKNRNFAAKKEYLLCLNILINKLKEDFSIYAKELLNNIYLFDKILFDSKLKNNDSIEFKKNLLDIIYTLLLYNKNKLNDEYKKILTYAKINKSDQNKDIRTISIKIIDIIIKNNFNNDIKINIKNYISNDFQRNTHSTKNINYKERALSFKNRDSQIKNLIEEDKKKYADKKTNKNFIFVSQSSMHDFEKISPERENYFTENKNNILKSENKTNSEKKGRDKNYNNLNVINLKINEIKNMNDSMIKAVNNMESNLNNNFNTIEYKLNNIDKFEENHRNRDRNLYINRNYYNTDKKNKYLDERIENIILNDEKLIKFIEEISENDMNHISLQYFEEILNRFMILYLINKNNRLESKKYFGLIQKLLDGRKINNKDDFREKRNSNKSNNNRKYKISTNLENNLDYLFNSLNN